MGVTLNCVANPQSCVNPVPAILQNFQGQSLQATAQYAPPVYNVPNVVSNDPAVYNSTAYFAALNAAGAAQQANDQNGRLYANFQNVYANWLYGGSIGPAPTPPSYVSPSDYGAPAGVPITILPAGTPIPASGYDQPGSAPYVPFVGSGSAPAPAQSVSGAVQSQPPAAPNPPQVPILVQSAPDVTNALSQPVNLFGTSFPAWGIGLAAVAGLFLLWKMK